MNASSAAALPQAFAERYGPRALILGGSEGIGAAFAEQLAACGINLTLVARSLEPLNATAAAIREKYGVDVDVRQIDLTRPDIQPIAEDILNEQEFGLLVYNAGATHGVSLFLDQPVANALKLVQLNCVSTVAFAHAALSAMRSRKRGGLILLSSMSAMAGAGYVATYAASKSFEMILAEGLNWELRREGIDVMCAVATLTDTPAMRRSGMIVDADPNFVPMDSADVAIGALQNLGKTAVWFAAGEAAAAALRAAPRDLLSDQMSRTSASLWGIET